jgi:MFS family permease
MGMMFGALFWGTFSDSNGRKLPFNMTLTITAFFGIAASFAPTFWSLCVFLFCLGFGVGGNMPTDGKLAENKARADL